MGGRKIDQRKKRAISVSFSIPEDEEAVLVAFDQIAKDVKGSNRSRELLSFMQKFVRKYTGIETDIEYTDEREPSNTIQITNEKVEDDLNDLQTNEEETFEDNEDKEESDEPPENEDVKIFQNNLKSTEEYESEDEDDSSMEDINMDDEVSDNSMSEEKSSNSLIQSPSENEDVKIFQNKLKSEELEIEEPGIEEPNVVRE